KDADKKDADKKDADKKDADKSSAKEGDNKDESKDAKKGHEPVKIDFDGLASRVARVPVDADNYNALSANKECLFYVRNGAGYYGRDSDKTTALIAFNLKERKPTTLSEDVHGYTMSSEGNKLLVREGPGFNEYDASSKGKDSKKAV